MSSTLPRIAALLMLAAAIAPPTAAQPAPRADPLDAKAKVPPLRHQSALSSYRRMDATEVGNWREANDQVSRIGGWRAYLRQAQQPDGAASAPHKH